MTGAARQGARNLLVNCAEVRAGERLLLICENPDLGWYDHAVADVLESEAISLGLRVSRLDVGAPGNEGSKPVADAIAANDVTVFLARIGDQDRFAKAMPGTRTVMSYAREEAQLAAPFGRVHHQAFVALKAAVDELLLNSSNVRITCPLGTDIQGDVSATGREGGDVSVRRFPLGVPQPMDAAGLSGRVRLAHFLTPTGSKVYDPPSVAIDPPVTAEISGGRVTRFTGDSGMTARLRAHHDHVAAIFDIDADVVHSFHAGIHPGTTYRRRAAADPDRWSNNVFTHPRFLHFHTCGAYAPGEICWMILDSTVSVDGRNLWDTGRFMAGAFEETRRCLDGWPELSPLFDAPSDQIGL